MSLFDDLLRTIRPEKKPAKPCLVIGCDEPRKRDGLCIRHNRDVDEHDPLLDGLEVPE